MQQIIPKFDISLSFRDTVFVHWKFIEKDEIGWHEWRSKRGPETKFHSKLLLVRTWGRRGLGILVEMRILWCISKRELFIVMMSMVMKGTQLSPNIYWGPTMRQHWHKHTALPITKWLHIGFLHYAWNSSFIPPKSPGLQPANSPLLWRSPMAICLLTVLYLRSSYCFFLYAYIYTHGWFRFSPPTHTPLSHPLSHVSVYVLYSTYH